MHGGATPFSAQLNHTENFYEIFQITGKDKEKDESGSISIFVIHVISSLEALITPIPTPSYKMLAIIYRQLIAGLAFTGICTAHNFIVSVAEGTIFIRHFVHGLF
ncbi:hypothetical protein ASD40_18725 [Paenibacillus sp. Root444D2]|nr:hypothetical protein ASD40_18725 [Paenibacillus sp. Root444D2]